MPRLPEITDRDQLPEEARHNYDLITARRGRVSGPFAVLLNSPEVAGRLGHLGTYVRFESALSGVDRELAIIATAREFDCPYEWAAHVRLARQEGVREEAIQAVANRNPLDGLPDDEALIVRYCREMFREHRVSDSTFRAAQTRYGDRGVTDLTATMGYYGQIACVLNAFEITPAADAPQLP